MKNAFTQESLSIRIDSEMLKNWKVNESSTSFLNVFDPKPHKECLCGGNKQCGCSNKNNWVW